MASYEEWNRALIDRFTNGLPQGAKIYLSVDEDLLESMALEFCLAAADNGTNDFLAAVRAEVVWGKLVYLRPLRGRYRDSGLPQGVAFLGATVLAACRMAEEEGIMQREYFSRLQAVLGLSGKGRLPGMERGYEAEEPLWIEWNEWLKDKGFQTSACAGSGSFTYINYPVSQSLLRDADREKLIRLFYQNNWKRRWDAPTLFSYVRSQKSLLSKHLRNVLDEREDFQRREAIIEAIYEVYEQWQDEDCPEPGKRGNRSWTRKLRGGLYRSEEPLLGSADYYLYPKQGRGECVESVEVWHENNVQTIRKDPQRSGWYEPVLPVGATELESGCEYRIKSPTYLGSLILPSRDFWILIPNSENPDSGEYASWGKPSLEEPFILLCKEELLSDIYCLQKKKLLKWNGESYPVFDNSNWLELIDCEIIGLNWDGVYLKNEELKEALQPNVRLFIGLSGGLRDRSSNAWLEGCPPQLTIFSRDFSEVSLQVISLLDNRIIREETIKTNFPISLSDLSTGEYQIEAKSQGSNTQRNFKIIDWKDLDNQPEIELKWRKINSEVRICGSLIEQIEQLEKNAI